MSFKAVSAFAGGITTIGAGIGIYFFNNSKNNTNKPPNLTKNSTEQVQEKKVKIQKKARNWSEIIATQEYKDAQTTGKLLNHISYSEEEIADNNANYFLVEMKEPQKDLVWNNGSEITIKKDGSIFFEFVKESGKEFGSIFYCFDTTTLSKIEELNFKNLKKCESQPLKHKFLVIATSNELKSSVSGAVFNKKFVEWHTNKPEILIEVKINTTIEKHKAEVLKIFHKDYQPTINNSHT